MGGPWWSRADLGSGRRHTALLPAAAQAEACGAETRNAVVSLCESRFAFSHRYNLFWRRLTFYPPSAVGQTGKIAGTRAK